MTWQRGRLAGRAENGSQAKRMIDIGARAAGRRLISSLQITLIRLEGGRNNEALLDPLPYCQSYSDASSARSFYVLSASYAQSLIRIRASDSLREGERGRGASRRVPSRHATNRHSTTTTLYKRRYWRQLFAKQASGHGWHLEADETEGGRE